MERRFQTRDGSLFLTHVPFHVKEHPLILAFHHLSQHSTVWWRYKYPISRLRRCNCASQPLALALSFSFSSFSSLQLPGENFLCQQSSQTLQAWCNLEVRSCPLGEIYSCPQLPVTDGGGEGSQIRGCNSSSLATRYVKFPYITSINQTVGIFIPIMSLLGVLFLSWFSIQASQRLQQNPALYDLRPELLTT